MAPARERKRRGTPPLTPYRVEAAVCPHKVWHLPPPQGAHQPSSPPAGSYLTVIFQQPHGPATLIWFCCLITLLLKLLPGFPKHLPTYMFCHCKHPDKIVFLVLFGEKHRGSKCVTLPQNMFYLSQRRYVHANMSTFFTCWAVRSQLWHWEVARDAQHLLNVASARTGPLDPATAGLSNSFSPGVGSASQLPLKGRM